MERWGVPGREGPSWLSPRQGWKDPKSYWRGSRLFQLPAAHDICREEKWSLSHSAGVPKHQGGVLWGNDLRLDGG